MGSLQTDEFLSLHVRSAQQSHRAFCVATNFAVNNGARGRNRTGTALAEPRDFKSLTSTCFVTRAAEARLLENLNFLDVGSFEASNFSTVTPQKYSKKLTRRFE